MNAKELKFTPAASPPVAQPEQPKKSDANELALQRTQMAVLRSFQAAERTLMAWVRTAMSMISFGFTIVKFFEYLHESKHRTFHLFGSAGLGMLLISIGIVSLVVAVVQHRRVIDQLGLTGRSQRWSLAVTVAIAMALLGVFALLAVNASY